MGADDDKNRNETLSRIIADLFAKPREGEDLSAKIHRLRDELKKVIESEDTIFGKFRGLVESFREDIPEETQRYNAAVKALLKTSKISRQEVIKAVNNQLEELKILEKGLLGTPSGWGGELKAMEAKSREIKDEILKLREKIGRLESEEKEILSGMAARGQEMGFVEKAVGELFADIGAEIAHMKKKVEEPTTAERAAPQPIPPGDSIKSNVPSQEKGSGEQKSEIPVPSAPQDTELQKTCPMCGGRMDLQIQNKMWTCYSCGHQESKEEKGGREQKSEIPVPSTAPQNTGSQKKCPMCGGRMDLLMNGEMWQCFSCAYEESEKGGVQGKSEKKSELTTAPKSTAAPLASLSSNEHQEPIKGSISGSSPSKKQPSTEKKTCPDCGGNMKWHETVWQCPFCGCERRS
jgi:ribosomal protein L37AE/L43A